MKKIILYFIALLVFAFCIPAIQAKAVTIPDGSSNIQPYTEGLIYSYYINVSNNNGSLNVNAKTSSNAVMKSIGLKNIKVEYSSDGINWATEKPLSDMLNSSSSEHRLNNYTVSVNGGYYYRISCIHYAKEKGLFGASQSEPNTSNSVWIS